MAPGPEQGAKAWESKRQAKVESDSLEEKPKVGVVSVVDSDGPELIVVWGAMVSTVKERETIALSFPGASIALTEKLWLPSGSGDPRVCGDEQVVK